MIPSKHGDRRPRSGGSRGAAAPRIAERDDRGDQPGRRTAGCRTAGSARSRRRRTRRGRSPSRSISACTQRPQRDRAREVLAAQLRAGCGRSRCRPCADRFWISIAIRFAASDHPQQQVAVLRAAGDVRREVAGVDVGDARRRRPGRGAASVAARAAARADALQRARAGVRRSRVEPRGGAAVGGPRPVGGGRHAATSTRIARGERAAERRASRRRSARTAGRRTAARSTTSSVVAGRDPALGEVAQHLRVGVGDAHERARARRPRARRARRVSPSSIVEVARRDRVAVRVVRRVAELAPRSAPRAPRRCTCSSTSASSWTRSHGTPSARRGSSSSSRWWRRTSSATRAARRRSARRRGRARARRGPSSASLLDHPRRRRRA